MTGRFRFLRVLARGSIVGLAKFRNFLNAASAASPNPSLPAPPPNIPRTFCRTGDFAIRLSACAFRGARIPSTTCCAALFLRSTTPLMMLSPHPLAVFIALCAMSMAPCFMVAHFSVAALKIASLLFTAPCQSPPAQFLNLFPCLEANPARSLPF